MTFKAFVSSTFNDLQEHRTYVIAALRNAGFQVDPMEDWTADSAAPTTFCLERLSGCQLCILLIGYRRGFPGGAERSITQMEYERAVEMGIDVLPFVLKKGSPWPEKFNESLTDPKFREWRESIEKRHGRGEFNERPESLDEVGRLKSALTRWVTQRYERERLRDYLAACRQAHREIRFLGLPQLKDNRDIRIDRLFVNPRLSEQPIPPGLDPGNWGATQELRDAVSTSLKLVVLGDPGSGKSTLVDWIICQLADECSNPWKDQFQRLIPLPLILRDLNIGQGITWDGLLEKFCHMPAGRFLSPEHLKRLLDEERMFVLLDGLDEIGNLLVRRDLRDAVHDGMRRYSGCLWLLTSRIVGYDSVPFDTPVERRRKRKVLGGSQEMGVIHEGLWDSDDEYSFAGLWYVAPFDDVQIEKFAKKWYEEREADSYRAQEGADNLLRAIHADPNTTRLARVPNLLTIMALIHRVHAMLPNGKALLYNKIAEAYLETIDGYRKIQESNDTLLDKRSWLATVAFEMQRQRSTPGGATLGGEREILVDGGQLRDWITRSMAASRKPSTEDEVQRFVDYIRRRSGLMIERSENHFAFSHLSFQEYFAACYIAEQLDTRSWARRGRTENLSRENLYQFGNDELWRETLVILVELLHAEKSHDSELLVEIGEALFGVDWQGLNATEADQKNRACLLGRLAVNPHAGAEADREGMLRVGLRWAIARQNLWEPADVLVSQQVLQILQTGRIEEQRVRLAIIAELVREMNCRGLSLCGLANSDLSPLAGLTSLQELDLSRSMVRDVRPLHELTGLRRLSLADTHVSDLSPLIRLAALEQLDLVRTPVENLEPLAQLTRLERLDLGQTRVLDLSPLVGLSRLEWLNLKGIQATDITPLAQLSGLHWLNLDGTEVQDLSPLLKLRLLRELSLRGASVGLQQVKHLRKDRPEINVSYRNEKGE